MKTACKPGGPPPSGYAAWHGWAQAQRCAGLTQKQCAFCGLWKFPQERSGLIVTYTNARGRAVSKMILVCSECINPPRHHE